MKTKQIVFTKPCVAELLDAEYEAPKAGEVTVSLEYSAISSGTEKANLVGQRNKRDDSEDAEIVFPRYCGYSAAGVVSAVGEGVKDVAVGDRVIVYWGKHKKNITVKRKNVVKIPEGVSTMEASMVHISTFPMGAIRKTKIEILGVFAVQQLRAAGAYPVIAVDPVADRREFALKMGADYALDPTEEGFAEKVIALSDGGVNVCIEVRVVALVLFRHLSA